MAASPISLSRGAEFDTIYATCGDKVYKRQGEGEGRKRLRRTDQTEGAGTVIQQPVILNGVSPRALVGAKRSEESLTVPWAEAGSDRAGFPRRLRVQSAILHSAFVAKPPKLRSE